MPRITKPRDIINRKALLKALDDLASWSGYSPKTQGEVLKLFKDAYQKGWDEIRRRFEQDGVKGSKTVRANAYLIDQLVTTIHDFALAHVYPAANPTTGEHMVIVATGGYGRNELAPFSDIDLMFLLPYKKTAHTEQVVEFILYTLWDLGLKVGHATRSVDEAVRLSLSDSTIRTSLLESRRLWGDEKLFAEFKKRYAGDVMEGTGRQFVDDKLTERDNRHKKMGDTRYVLEPNIKEGKGGLRDLQSLFWITKYLYRVDDVKDLVSIGVLTSEDVRLFTRAQEFLWTVRCHLHYLAGRPEERVTFNVQEDIGRRMAYTDRPGARGVERFMKHYFLVAKDVGDLTRVICAVLEEQQKKQRFRLPSFSFGKKTVPGFAVDGNRLTVENDDDFKSDPLKLLSLFREAQTNRLDIHPHALRLVSQNLRRINDGLRNDAEANRIFLEMLTDDTDPLTTLKRLNEAGVFGRFIPDFGRVVSQMQYDMYHVYTVDEHTIRAIGILSRIERGELKEDHPVASSVIGELQSRRVLYMAVLLHDIAKGRGGDHSEIGAEIALKLCPRFGFSEWETETVSWLVAQHLAMSRTAFKRDLDDSKTVRDFIETVQSPERLRLLLILTVADIRAVGPKVWNGWKANLLRELYYRAMEEMTGQPVEGARSNRADRMREQLRDVLSAAPHNWPQADVEAHLARGRYDYWLSFDSETLLHHALLIDKAEKQGLQLHIETRIDKARSATELAVYTHDHAGLFAQVAGAMALSGVSIVDANINTLTNGMALDTFWIQDSSGGHFGGDAALNRLWKRIEEALSGKLHPKRELEAMRAKAIPSRTHVFKVPPRVLVDNKASASHTVIEVNGRDRLGFLYDVTAAITNQNLQIASAHISTYGERVVDVFYVRDVFGLKVDNEHRLAQVRESLLAAIAAPVDAGKEAKAGKKTEGGVAAE